MGEFSLNKFSVTANVKYGRCWPSFNPYSSGWRNSSLDYTVSSSRWGLLETEEIRNACTQWKNKWRIELASVQRPLNRSGPCSEVCRVSGKMPRRVSRFKLRRRCFRRLPMMSESPSSTSSQRHSTRRCHEVSISSMSELFMPASGFLRGKVTSEGCGVASSIKPAPLDSFAQSL